jgi:hypothetical protein
MHGGDGVGKCLLRRAIIMALGSVRGGGTSQSVPVGHKVYHFPRKGTARQFT